jgi:hypothetical protein
MVIAAVACEVVAMLYRGTPMAMSETMTLFAAASLFFACLLFLPSWLLTPDSWFMAPNVNLCWLDLPLVRHSLESRSLVRLVSNRSVVSNHTSHSSLER